MIIKSTIRGGYLSAAQYMKDIGENEKTRLVELSDPEAKNLDDAFQKMWEVACPTKVKKPLHHISINPMKGEHLTDKQVLAIADRCEEVYGYKMFHHQRVIVEHVKDGRQHFHVIWNRVSLVTGKAVWPGHHWKKSKQVAREMEDRLGLKRPQPRSTGAKGSKTRTAKPRSTGLRLSNPDRKSPQTKSKSAPPPARYRPERKKAAPPPPMQPTHPKKKRWPDQAIIDWEVWGHLWPRRSSHSGLNSYPKQQRRNMSTKRIKTKCFTLNRHKRRVYRVMEENTAELFFLSKTQAALYVLKLQQRKMTNKKR